MRDYGLGSAHTICMRILSENTKGLTQNEISKKSDVDKAQTSRVLGELVDKGYVFATDTDKIYNKIYRLTDVGMVIAKDIDRRVTEICNYVSGDIPDADMEAFYITLEKISNRILASEKVFFDTGNNKK